MGTMTFSAEPSILSPTPDDMTCFPDDESSWSSSLTTSQCVGMNSAKASEIPRSIPSHQKPSILDYSRHERQRHRHSKDRSSTKRKPVPPPLIGSHWSSGHRTMHPRSRPLPVSTPKWFPSTQVFMTHRFVALDCEMVGVGPGGKRSVLARASLVDFYGRCIFDTFVRVDEEVSDFRTHVSGIHPGDLTSAKAISFQKCRSIIRDMIENKILIGHGLKNDLSVLDIQHPWWNLRDTCLYQPYMKEDQFGNVRLPSRLRDLAWLHLGILIQREGTPHNSLEDACAAMALYRNVQREWDLHVDCKRRSKVLHSPLHNVLSVM